MEQNNKLCIAEHPLSLFAFQYFGNVLRNAGNSAAMFTDTLIDLRKEVTGTGCFLAFTVREEVGKFVYPYPCVLAFCFVFDNSLPEIFQNNL